MLELDLLLGLSDLHRTLLRLGTYSVGLFDFKWQLLSLEGLDHDFHIKFLYNDYDNSRIWLTIYNFSVDRKNLLFS